MGESSLRIGPISSYDFSMLFQLLNLAVMPLWFGLLFFPKKPWVRIAIDSFAAVAALIFVWNLLPGLKGLWPVILDPTIPKVSRILSTPEGAFGAWTHFLIGDLWSGRWIVSEAQGRGIPHPWILPILVLTLLLGPVGLLAFLILRTAHEKFRG